MPWCARRCGTSHGVRGGVARAMVCEEVWHVPWCARRCGTSHGVRGGVARAMVCEEVWVHRKQWFATSHGPLAMTNGYSRDGDMSMGLCTLTMINVSNICICLYHQLSDISIRLYPCVYIRVSIHSHRHQLSDISVLLSSWVYPLRPPSPLSLKHLHHLSLSNTSHTHTNAGDIFKFG